MGEWVRLDGVGWMAGWKKLDGWMDMLDGWLDKVVWMDGWS
jgi:hypothetical protein